MALFAFRGFFATFFIELLSYGFTGVGALLIGVLVSGIVYNSAKRLIMPLGKHVKEELRWDILAEIEELRRQIRDLEKAKSQLMSSSAAYNENEVKRIEEEIKEKSERITELEKRV
jgi:septal ring factor EnvC (AmiA/AmiB activator)